MVNGLRVHRLDKAQFIHDLRCMRHQITHPGAGLTMLSEFEYGSSDGEARLRGGHPGQTLALSYGIWQLRALKIIELGLVVKQVHLRWRPRLEQVNHPFGFGRKVRKTWKSTRLCALV